MYEICLGRPLPENGQEWQDLRDGNLSPMDGTEFDLQMTVRSMMAPDHSSRPSAEELLRKRQLMSEDQRQLIVERNKANEANRALNVQMVRHGGVPMRRLGLILTCLFFVLLPCQRRFEGRSPRPKFSRSNTIC